MQIERTLHYLQSTTGGPRKLQKVPRSPEGSCQRDPTTLRQQKETQRQIERRPQNTASGPKNCDTRSQKMPQSTRRRHSQDPTTRQQKSHNKRRSWAERKQGNSERIPLQHRNNFEGKQTYILAPRGNAEGICVHVTQRGCQHKERYRPTYGKGVVSRRCRTNRANQKAAREPSKGSHRASACGELKDQRRRATSKRNCRVRTPEARSRAWNPEIGEGRARTNAVTEHSRAQRKASSSASRERHTRKASGSAGAAEAEAEKGEVQRSGRERKVTETMTLRARMASQRATQRKSIGAEGGSLAQVTLSKIF